MNDLQFDYDPLTPAPTIVRSKFPWALVLFGLGLMGLILAAIYAISNPDIEEIPTVSDEEPSSD